MSTKDPYAPHLPPAIDASSHVLVTGGAGFIGSNIVHELAATVPGVQLTVVDDFRLSDWRNLVGVRACVRAFDISRTDLKALFKTKPITHIFHLASITDTTVHDSNLMIHDNVEGFHRLLELEAPMVYASSAAVYGIAEGINREKDERNPANVYGFSKCVLEDMAAVARKDGQFAVGLRFFNVYGPRETHKGAARSMALQLAQLMSAGKRPRIFSPGEQKRDFVYVKDVVAQCLAAMRWATAPVYNAGSGKSRSFNDMVAGLNQILGTQLAPDYFECPFSFYQPFTQADMSLARAHLQDFQPRFQLEEGMADYFADRVVPVAPSF